MSFKLTDTANPHCSAPGTACRNAGPQAADTAPPFIAKITENARNIESDKKRHACNSGFAIAQIRLWMNCREVYKYSKRRGKESYPVRVALF